MGNLSVKTDTLCGCNTCACLAGGYQVHLTINYADDRLIHYLATQNTELIKIRNYLDKGSYYVEFITSRNFKKLNKALHYMGELALAITNLGYEVIRQKIESNPKNEDDYLYKEIHYKITEEDISKLIGRCFFSKNSKGTWFATQRFFPGQKVELLHDRSMIEDVIYDSNLKLDDRLVKNDNSSRNRTQAAHTAL